MLRVSNVLKLTLVLAISMIMLVFVGQGEARRSYPRFALEKLLAQAELAQTPIKSFLQADQPLNQYPGFETQTTPILESDRSLYAIYITRPDGSILFENRNLAVKNQSVHLDFDNPATLASFSTIPNQSRKELTKNDDFYQVTLPLENRFGTQGFLHLALPVAPL